MNIDRETYDLLYETNCWLEEACNRYRMGMGDDQSYETFRNSAAGWALKLDDMHTRIANYLRANYPPKPKPNYKPQFP